MEERFIRIGNKLAEDIANKYNIRNDDELKKICQQHEYAWFIADCSDDYYGRTVPEQKALADKLYYYITTRQAETHDDM